MSTLSAQEVTGSSTADALAGAFTTFGPAFMKWMTAGIRDAGVSFPRLRLLHVLHTGGPQIMSSVRDHLGVTARSVTALVDGLEADGLVRRTAHPSDRRATVLELTEAGSLLVHERFAELRGRAASLFERLDHADQVELLRLMEQLIQALRDAGATEGCPVHLPVA